MSDVADRFRVVPHGRGFMAQELFRGAWMPLNAHGLRVHDPDGAHVAPYRTALEAEGVVARARR